MQPLPGPLRAGRRSCGRLRPADPVPFYDTVAAFAVSLAAETQAARSDVGGASVNRLEAIHAQPYVSKPFRAGYYSVVLVRAGRGRYWFDGTVYPVRAGAVTVRHRAEHEALQAGRRRERTAEFAADYARRAGVEGTTAQGTRSHGLRRSRYVGLAKTHLQHLMTAAAMNVVRLLRWLARETKAVTRPSAFARLYLAPSTA